MNETELKGLLETLHKDLNTLREREAKFGGNAPLDLLNQIEDHQTAIALVQSRLAGEISDETLQEKLAPLNISRDGGRTEIIAGDKVSGGKNYIQIGTLVIPAVPLLAAMLLLITGAAFLAWIYLVPDKMPLNTFNVVVAEFGQVDVQRKISSSEDGRNLSEWMFRELQTEYKKWPTGQPVIWHDSMSFLEKRGKIGLISGQTPQEKDEAAAALAKRIGADMVIYGNIVTDQDKVHFIPEFYIAEIRNEADEIVGSQQLGAPIEVQLPINLYDDSTSAFFEEKLGVRSEALVWFTRGLAFDLSGRHKDALDIFKRAKEELNWDQSRGEDILYYFIGREALFIGRYDPEVSNKAEADSFLNEAEMAFKEALAINPNYARAHIGLGGVYFQRAQYLPPAERLKTNNLVLAIDQYELAIESGPDSSGNQVELKGRLGLGIAYRLQGEAYLHAGEYIKADSSYDLAIKEIGNALTLLSQDQHRLLAQAYLGLGAAYEQKAYIQYVQEDKAKSKPLYEEARAAYERCSEQADKEFYDSLLREIKTKYCDRYSQEIQQVLDNL